MRVDSHLTVHFDCVVLCALSLRHELQGHLNTTEPLSMMLVTPESKCLQRKGPLDFLNGAKLVFLWLLPAEKTSVFNVKSRINVTCFRLMFFWGFWKIQPACFCYFILFLLFFCFCFYWLLLYECIHLLLGYSIQHFWCSRMVFFCCLVHCYTAALVNTQPQTNHIRSIQMLLMITINFINKNIWL